MSTKTIPSIKKLKAQAVKLLKVKVAAFKGTPSDDDFKDIISDVANGLVPEDEIILLQMAIKEPVLRNSEDNRMEKHDYLTVIQIIGSLLQEELERHLRDLIIAKYDAEFTYPMMSDWKE